MKLCHPLDIVFERVASKVVLKATCTAPHCGWLYARLIDKTMPFTEDMESVYCELDSWSSYLTIKRMVDEMLCHDSGFCEPCFAGEPMKCHGIPAHARQ